MNTTDRIAQLEQTIIGHAQHCLNEAAEHANPDNPDDEYKAISLLSNMPIREARDGQAYEALTKVLCLTDLTATGSGLTRRSRKALLAIRDRATMLWQDIDAREGPAPHRNH